MEIRFYSKGARRTVYSLHIEGERSVLEWLRELKETKIEDARKIVHRLEQLQESGPTHNTTQFRKISEFDVWEAKSRNCRMVFFEDGKDLVILTLGFDKPQKKVQNRLLRKAGDLRRNYFEAKRKGEVTVVYEAERDPPLKGI